MMKKFPLYTLPLLGALVLTALNTDAVASDDPIPESVPVPLLVVDQTSPAPQTQANQDANAARQQNASNAAQKPMDTHQNNNAAAQIDNAKDLNGNQNTPPVMD